MIVYPDTSSLVKLYVEEIGSESVRQWTDKAEIVATCRVAYPEMMSALHRRFRSGDVSRKEYQLLTIRFSEEWADFAVIDFDEIEAGRLAQKHALRGFDAVHLSSARMLLTGDDEITPAFSSFDRDLNRAATREGLKVLSS